MAASFHIRPATISDRSAVTQLFRRSYPQLLPAHYEPDILRAALPLITTAQPALLECGTYFLAQDGDGRVIGAGGWTDISPTRGVAQPDEGHVRHVATHPDCLRRGIAARLIERTVSSAKGFGVSRMNCMSTLAALDFYKAMGFEAQSEVELTLRPGVFFPAVQMTRAI